MTKVKRVGVFFLALILMGGIAFGFVLRTRNTSTASASESALSINAKSALLMDYNTGTIVYEQNASARMPIASMVKIMTLNLVFEEIEKGNLTLGCMVTVSANAGSMGGSQAFLDVNSSYSVSDLVKTIIVSSANDSCVALAEHIAGSTEAFVVSMNDKATGLGMNDTNFANCTGLPSPNGYSTAKDVALMTRELLRHGAFFDYASVWMFDFAHPGGRTTSLSNTNKLVRFYEGCDGGKTGFTNEAMYCLSATAKRGSTRLISVVMGATTSKERNAQNVALFNWGFANFETRQLVLKGENIVDPVLVTKGKQDSVNLLTDGELFYFGKKGKLETSMQAVTNPLKAPVIAGQQAGELIVTIDGVEAGRVNLVTESEVAKKTYLDNLNDAIAAW